MAVYESAEYALEKHPKEKILKQPQEIRILKWCPQAWGLTFVTVSAWVTLAIIWRIALDTVRRGLGTSQKHVIKESWASLGAKNRAWLLNLQWIKSSALIIYAHRGTTHTIFCFFSLADAKCILTFLHSTFHFLTLYFLPEDHTDFLTYTLTFLG